MYIWIVYSLKKRKTTGREPKLYPNFRVLVQLYLKPLSVGGKASMAMKDTQICHDLELK